MKTNELIGPALDWAVAKCEFPNSQDMVYYRNEQVETAWHGRYVPSTDWSHGGPIIERGGISVIHDECAEEHWVAQTDHDLYGEGPTPLIAAMRCYVASKLGDDVEIPEELQ
jgi:hypothetical protein